MWAGLFGLILGGPVGWVAGLAVGASAGAITAKVVDIGVSDEWVGWFKDVVQPGTATVVLLVEDLDRDALVAEAVRFSDAELIYADLDDATIERVKDALAGHVPVTDHARFLAPRHCNLSIATHPRRGPSPDDGCAKRGGG